MSDDPEGTKLPPPVSSAAGTSMPDLKHLHDEHEELESLVRQLSHAIAQNEPPEARKLYTLRMKLASTLIHHLKTEDWVLYPCLLQSSNEQVALTARAFSAAMGGLAQDFRNYVNRWGAKAIQDDWKGYQTETANLLRALAQRIAREERDLYPLFEKIERRQ